ncbi:MAG: HDIG domain-containing protein [Saprospiraceae bacterium]|nr:HDIG domain-containing protein [Saprospiraceae bacterium]
MNAREAKCITQEIELLFYKHGNQNYGEDITQLEHAIQCAQLAEAGDHPVELVLAALLHDIGHLLEDERLETMDIYGSKYHDTAGAAYLANLGFPLSVTSIIEGHVAAKRYLTYADPEYKSRLSAASLHTLQVQGGPMSKGEAAEFRNDPLFEQMVLLRRWDDEGKKQEHITWSHLQHYIKQMHTYLLDLAPPVNEPVEFVE